jgi:hypothetical protein
MGGADAEVLGVTVEGRLVESGVGEQATDRRAQVGVRGAAGPDDVPAGGQKGGDRADGRLDVRSADVAEDAAEQEQVGRQRVGEGARGAGVADEDPDVAEPVRPGAALGLGGQGRVVLDQDGAPASVGWSSGEGSKSQDGEEVAPVAGAEAQDPLGPGAEHVERLGDASAHHDEAARQRGIRVVVSLVPANPVLHDPLLGPSASISVRPPRPAP